MSHVCLCENPASPPYRCWPMLLPLLTASLCPARSVCYMYFVSGRAVICVSDQVRVFRFLMIDVSLRQVDVFSLLTVPSLFSQVRVFRFLTGKLTRVLDESITHYTELQQAKQQVPSMEFGKR